MTENDRRMLDTLFKRVERFQQRTKKRHRKPIKTKTENGDQERKGWKGNIKKGKKKKGYTKRREK